MKNLNELVETEVKPMVSGDALHADVEKLSVEERLINYCVVQFEQDKLAKRREVLNARLKQDVKQVGLTNDKGHIRFEINGTVATVEKRVTKMPEQEGLETLLAKAGLSLDDVSDTVTVKQINPSKIEYLVELGKLKAADVDALRKVTFALSVDPSEVVSQALAEATKPVAPSEAPKAAKKKTKAT